MSRGRPTRTIVFTATVREIGPENGWVPFAKGIILTAGSVYNEARRMVASRFRNAGRLLSLPANRGFWAAAFLVVPDWSVPSSSCDGQAAMASGTADSPVSSARGATSGGGQADQFIQRQLGKTRFNVKLVELSTAGLVLLGAVLTLVFLAILVDHWIFDLGTVGRWCLLSLLLLGVAAYVARFIVPLLIKRINPLYAA